MSVKDDFKELEDKILEDSTTSWDDRFDNIVLCMEYCADCGDLEFKQLRKELEKCTSGPDSSAYRAAVGDYVRTMARTGDHRVALSAACKAAGIKSPFEPDGKSVDDVIQNFRAARNTPDVRVIKPRNGLRAVAMWLFKPPTASE